MRALALSATAMMLCGLTSGAFAGPDVYCDAYARDIANRKTGQEADTLAGTIGGAIGGTVTGGVTDEKWHRSYDKTFAACMDSYKPRDVEAISEPAPAKKSGKPKPGTRQWADYCATHYRSYDADTGKYKSYSGEMRPCR